MKITLYTKLGCGWCAEVLDLFAEKNVIFEEKEVTENTAFYKELMEKSGQTKTPTLDIDGEIFADIDAEEATEILKKKNYRGF